MAIKFYNTREFGEICKIHDTTIGKWCLEGKLNAINLNPGGKYARWQIPETEIEVAKKLHNPKPRHPKPVEPVAEVVPVANNNVLAIPIKDDVIKLIKGVLPTLLPQVLRDYLSESSKPVVPEIGTKPSFANAARTEIKFFIDNSLLTKLQKRAKELNTSVAILIDALLDDGIKQLES